MAEEPLGPLIARPQLQPRQNTKVIWSVFGAAVIGVGVLVVLKSGGSPVPLRGELRDRLVSEDAIGSEPVRPTEDLRLPTSYMNTRTLRQVEPALPPEPPLSPAIAPTGGLRTEEVPTQTVSIPVSTQDAPRRPVPPRVPPELARPTQGFVPPRSPATAPGAPQEKPKPPRWFSQASAPAGDILTPPLPLDPEGEAGEGGKGKSKGSTLFPEAVWARPANPLRVIYSSQLLNTMLEHAIVTGESATVRLRLVEALYDKFGQGQVLLPVDTRILATAEGAVKRGQNRIGVTMQKAELPDGTDLLLTGKGGPADGSVGIPGKVDNKIGQTLAAAGISAVLSLGARSIAGNQTGYAPTLGQETARDLGESINSSAQEIVKRSLDVQPQISVEAQIPVVVQLSQNISLQTAPVVVRK